MDITFLGHSCFRIATKNASLITDPYSSGSIGLKFPNVSATIVTVSHNHDDHSNSAGVKNVKKVISGPGEYEVEGISIIGIPSFHDANKGADRGKNTMYIIEVDGFRVAHLGDLGHKLSEDQGTLIGEIDVLMVPVGGNYTIGPADAVTVVQTIEPKIVIPMHYRMPGLSEEMSKALEPLESFESALGLKPRKEAKLQLKPESILPEEQQLIVLEKV